MNALSHLNIVCLAGGVGGAKLAEGLAQIVAPEKLTIIVNTGDDFTHLGLTICPDLDTVVYTLGHVANTETGWGRQDESWQVLTEISQLNGPDWFRLGDKDLALTFGASPPRKLASSFPTLIASPPELGVVRFVKAQPFPGA